MRRPRIDTCRFVALNSVMTRSLDATRRSESAHTLSAAAAVPVLHLADGVRVQAEHLQLREFAQAALELGETGVTGQAEHVVPQLDGVGGRGLAGDHRTEEGHTVRWVDVQDRGAHVLAGERAGLLGLLTDFLIPRGVMQGTEEIERQ